VPECRLLWARTLEEAHVRSFGLRIALFLLDVELPDGNGLDFLMEMQQAQPSARAIVLSAADLPATPLSSPNLGVLQFLRKPVESAALAKIVRETLAAWAHGTGAFRANLQDLTPMDVLQLKCLSNATTILEFRSQRETGRMHIVRGEVIHAETGDVTGIEAVGRIISWKGGAIAEKPPGSAPVPQTIDCGWQALLMHAAQLIDEAETPG